MRRLLDPLKTLVTDNYGFHILAIRTDIWPAAVLDAKSAHNIFFNALGIE